MFSETSQVKRQWPRRRCHSPGRLVTGVRERGRPDPGCSAAQGRGGFNVTSWSSYREFADRTLCQEGLATISSSAAGEDGSWGTSSAEARAGPLPGRGGGEGSIFLTSKQLRILLNRFLCELILHHPPTVMTVTWKKTLNECENEW